MVSQDQITRSFLVTIHLNSYRTMETPFESTEKQSNAGETSTLQPNIMVQRGVNLNYAYASHGSINYFYGTTIRSKQPAKEQLEAVQDIVYSGISLCLKEFGVSIEPGDVKSGWKVTKVTANITREGVRYIKRAFQCR